jgi:hypothetical protein
MNWQAIGLVTSGLTLVAFIYAAFAWAYRQALGQRESLIRAAPEAERAELIERTIRDYHIETEGLTKKDRLTVTLELIRERKERYRIQAVVVVIVAILSTIGAVFALTRPVVQPEGRHEPVQTGDVNDSAITADSTEKKVKTMEPKTEKNAAKKPEEVSKREAEPVLDMQALQWAKLHWMQGSRLEVDRLIGKIDLQGSLRRVDGKGWVPVWV